MRKYLIATMAGLLLLCTPAIAHTLTAAHTYSNGNAKNAIANFLVNFDNCRIVGNAVPGTGPVTVSPVARAQRGPDATVEPASASYCELGFYTAERGEGGEMSPAAEPEPDVRPDQGTAGNNPIVVPSASINEAEDGAADMQKPHTPTPKNGADATGEAAVTSQTSNQAEMAGASPTSPDPADKNVSRRNWFFIMLGIAALVGLFMMLRQRRQQRSAPSVKDAPGNLRAAEKQTPDKNPAATNAERMSIYFPALNRGYSLRPGTMILGSSPASDIVLDDPGIARVHAEFCTNGNCTVKDAIISAGIKLNGKTLEGASTLKPGDTLEFGTVKAVVRRVVE